MIELDEVLELLASTAKDEHLKEIVTYAASKQGKRIRPTLVVLFYNAVHGKKEDQTGVLPGALAAEILHTYSLVIDDIIDNARTRRGFPSTNAKFGDVPALLGGLLHREALLDACMNVTDQGTAVELLNMFSKCIREAIEGEFLDLRFTESVILNPYLAGIKKVKITEKDYFTMVRKKTAWFVATCCEAGVLLGDGGLKQRLGAWRFGLNLGIAYQITDDIIDITGNPYKTGKESCKDIVEGKLGNYPLLLAMRKMTAGEKKIIHGILRKGCPGDGEKMQVVDLIKKYNGFNRAKKTADKFIFMAKGQISSFPNNEATASLLGLADMIGNREA